MVDTLTPQERSRRMSLIRSANTSPELILRRALHRRGLRYTLGNKDLPGKPDLVFRRQRVAVFVHGCFWHRHEGCKVATMPKSNSGFWQQKFDKNVERDARALLQLEEMGWRVEVAWECELSHRNMEATIDRIERSIRS